MQLPYTTGLTRLVSSSKGIAYFDALDVCRFYEIDVQPNQFVLDRWEAVLKLMSFDPEHPALDGSLWIPFVMIVTFLESMGLKREQLLPSETVLESTKHLRSLAIAMSEFQFAEVRRALA